MARYIDAEFLMGFLHAGDFGTPDERWKPESEFALMISATPTADVAEVKHGEWELEHETYGNMVCSVCRKQCPKERKPDPYEDYQMTDFYVESQYCPHCGAKMDGGKGE